MNNNSKKEIAVKAKKLLNEKLSFSEFLGSIPDSLKEDEQVKELIDLIEHMPGKKGFFGVSLENTYKLHIKEVNELIEKIIARDN